MGSSLDRIGDRMELIEGLLQQIHSAACIGIPVTPGADLVQPSSTLQYPRGNVQVHIGIIGLPNSGKTTIYNCLTGGESDTATFSTGRFEVQHAMVEVPDERVEALVEMFQPKKTTRARIEFHDIAGLGKGISEGGLSGEIQGAVAQNDALLHVIRAFDNEDVPHPDGGIDPARDLAVLDSEFLFSDLMIAERRIEKLQAALSKGGGKPDERKLWEAELPLLERIQAALMDEIPLRDIDMTPAEEKMIRGYQFLSQKPVLIVFNIGESDDGPATEALVSYEHRQSVLVSIKGRLEMELAQMSEEDRAIFLDEYGITEAGIDRVIRESYGLLGLQSFFTVGEKEVRAWTLRKGGSALDAAGTIHTDLARGFIRAEVISYTDLSEAGGLVAAKQNGTLRLEGRDYIMHDGDAITVRFNV